MSSMIERAVGRGPDFSQIASMQYEGPNSMNQKFLETSVRICDLDAVKLALENGAIADPRFLDQAILSWEENKKKVHEYARNGLFSNRAFLPMVNLLRDSLPGMSGKGLERLHQSFKGVYFNGQYEEIVSFKGEVRETGGSFQIGSKPVYFTDSEFAIITDLYPIISKIYKEKMHLCWIDTPKQPAELTIAKFTISISPCLQSSPCQHYCKIVLSNGHKISKLLGGRDIICLSKATPHYKHHHPKCTAPDAPEELYGPEEYYDHFSNYDSLEMSPQLAETTLKTLFNENVQVESNEEYFTLLRAGTLNHSEIVSEKTIRKDRFHEKTMECVRKFILQVQSSLIPLPNLEIRLLRAFWVLHLKEFQEGMNSVSLLIQTGKLRDTILSEIIAHLKSNNSTVKFEDEKELNAYLSMRVDNDIGFDECPIPSTFEGSIFHSLKNFEGALTQFLS